jgi:hypothetical protein
MTSGPTDIDLSTCTEDDIVEIFRLGLSAFVERAGGSFSSRRVTLRQERSYPSDQDYALVFTSPRGFRLHLFGLQFKRWADGGWAINSQQADALRRLAHVVGYCLPRPCATVVSNSLHAFYFLNPSCLPSRCSALRLLYSFGDDHQHDKDGNWAHLRLNARSSINDRGDNIPRLSWGEFFSALETGAVIVAVPGGPKHPPGPDSKPGPQDQRQGTGLGLTITCPGPWGTAWARGQITEHVRFWSKTVLSPPAAVIAFESFSRSIDFIEVAA